MKKDRSLPQGRPRRRPKRFWIASSAFHAALLALVALLAPVMVRYVEKTDTPMLVVRPKVPPPLPSLPVVPFVELAPAPLPRVEAAPEDAPEVEFEAEAPADPILSPELAEAALPVAATEVLVIPGRPHRPAPVPAPPAPSSVTPRTPHPPSPGPTRRARLASPLEPEYPERLRARGECAEVLLEALLDERGHADEVRVLSGDAPKDAVRSAVAAVRAARFEPALQSGRPVRDALTIKVVFRLE